jgi:hypothetical protein
VTTKKILDILALIIQIMATAFMFFNSPVNVAEGGWISATNPDMETPRKKNKNLKRGFLFLCLGFCIQLISLIIS